MTIPMRNDYDSTRLLELVEQRQPLDDDLITKSNLSNRDSQGQNALYWAIKNHSTRNVALLLKHKISLFVGYQLDALFHAVDSKNLEVLVILLSTGLNIDTQNFKAQSLLMKAIEQENIMMVQYLLNQGIDLYCMDENYDMAEDYAKRSKNQRVFELVHYKILSDKAATEQSDCTACGVEEQRQCSIVKGR